MTANAVQKLYVAYFNRPADTVGLNYWVSVVAANGGSTALVSAAFASSAEYAATYAGLSTAARVDAIYTNLFGRSAEPVGLTYWSQLIESGRISISNAVTQIAGGAQGADLVAYNSKVSAAESFTTALNTTAEIVGYSGTTANNAAKVWLSGIRDVATQTAAVVPAVLDASVATIVAASVSAPTSAALTTIVDSIPASSTQIVTGVDNQGGVAGGQTFNTGDTVAGASAVNVLFSAVTVNAVTADINNTAAFNGQMLAAATVNAALFDGVLAINSAGGGLSTAAAQNTLTVTNGDVATTYGIRGDTSAAGMSVGVRAAQLAGTNDTVKFSVAGAGSSVSVAGASAITSIATLTSSTTGVENISVATTGTNVFSVTGSTTALTDANKFIVTGNGSNTMTVSALTQVSEYDLSGSTGTNTLNVAGTLTTGDTVRGGSGTDTLRVGNNTTIANLTVTGVETLRLSTTNGNGNSGNMIFAADPAFTTIRVDGDLAETGTNTLTGIGSAARVTYVGDGSTANAGTANQFNSLTVNNSYAGANESVAIAIGNGGIVNTATTGGGMGTITLNGAENLNITISDQAATSVTTFTGLVSTTLTSVAVTSAGSVVLGNISGVPAAGAGNLVSLNLSGVAGTAASTATLITNTVGAGTVVTAGVGGLTLNLGVEATTDSLTFTGAAGVDTVNGNVGGNIFTGILIADGGAGNDVLNGGANADVLTGGAGADVITGGAGADILTGGEGADTITGGAGRDTIILSETTSAVDSVILMDVAGTTADADTITGFRSASDTLTIDGTAVTATIGTQIAAGVNAAATLVNIQAAADTDAPVYWISNTHGLTLTQIETAITAGTGATGETFIFVDNGTSTLLFHDAAAQTDAGAGAGMILFATLVGVTGATSLVTGDLLVI